MQSVKGEDEEKEEAERGEKELEEAEGKASAGCVFLVFARVVSSACKTSSISP